MLDQEERDRIVEEHLGLARALAVKVRNRHGLKQDLDDLIASGNAGLVEAATRWDPGRGVAFSTFAYYRIRGAIYDGLRKQGLFSRRHLLRFDAGADAVMQEQVESGGGGAQGSGAPGGSKERLTRLAGTLGEIAAIYVVSLDDGARPEQADLDPPDIIDQLDNREASVELRRVIKQLPVKERRLIRLHYFQQKSLAAAGAELGLSRSWACRLHARAVRRLAQLMPKRE